LRPAQRRSRFAGGWFKGVKPGEVATNQGERRVGEIPSILKSHSEKNKPGNPSIKKSPPKRPAHCNTRVLHSRKGAVLT